MEANMIKWKKKHMEAKGTFTSWQFSFTPTNISVALESAIEVLD